MKYSAPLDGIRAVAIIPVILFHMFPQRLAGGFTGVDVFFVLSGFLITSVILSEIRSGQFSIREFYVRRVQRLIPNAVAMVLATLAISAVLLLPSFAVRTAEHSVWTLLNASNIYIYYFVGGYWGDSAASLPLLHTWSLAVEEQFYLVLPFSLLLLTRRAGERTRYVILAFTCASLGLSIWRTTDNPESAFYLLPTRAWEPLLGATLAAFRMPSTADGSLRVWRNRRAKEVIGWLGVTAVTVGVFVIADDRRFPGVLALAPALGTLAMIVAIADGDTSLARVLSAPWLVTIGVLSYSLYLWHWPCIVIGRTYAELTGWNPKYGAFVGVAVSLMLAVAAHRFIEQPLRARGPGRRRRLTITAGGFVTCLAVSTLLSRAHPDPDPTDRFDQPTLEGLRYAVAGASTPEVASSAIRYSDVSFAAPEPHAADIWRAGGIRHAWSEGSPRVVVLGSSHALMYSALIDDICRRNGLPVAFLSADGTGVFFPTHVGPTFPTSELAGEFDDSRRRWLREWRPDAIIVVERWDYYARDPAAFERESRDLVSELASYSPHVIVFSQVPVLRVGETVNLREFVTWSQSRNGSMPRISPDVCEPVRASSVSAFERLAHEFPQLQLIRADELFSLNDGSVRYLEGRSFLYADDDHLSSAGAELLRESCERAILAACGR